MQISKWYFEELKAIACVGNPDFSNFSWTQALEIHNWQLYEFRERMSLRLSELFSSHFLHLSSVTYYTSLRCNVCHMYNSAAVFPTPYPQYRNRIPYYKERERGNRRAKRQTAISNLIETTNTPYMHTIVLLNNFVDVIGFMSWTIDYRVAVQERKSRR